MTTSARKTAPRGRIPSYYEFAPHTFESRLCRRIESIQEIDLVE
jgi:hypothetical protein